ncbi:MAG TPA: phosphate ABC transporter ATP-binding protein [Propionibacteriaceae bacterium]|jgi:tungstate transport system ATP-binding protein|nr:phosphate ABC transporter ATP-binding protein [Propionibacteriaceae bacterium]
MTAVLPITVRDLSFRPGGRIVLDRLDATITSAGITALIGPNGAGKSVTLRIIDGLLQPDDGTIRFGNRLPQDVRRALVFQRPGLLRASIARNVALALVPWKLSRQAIAERVDQALVAVGLAHRADEAARRLSGGEQQRLALARAWVTEPELLLLDEPTASLDPGATEEIERLIVRMARNGTKVVLVSHNLGQVARLAEDIIVISRGQAVEHGPARRILSAPRSAEAQAYIKGELPWIAFSETRTACSQP